MIQAIEEPPPGGAVDAGRAGQSDEELLAELLAGRQEVLQTLHQRHAPLVFHIACRSLDAAAAEEITQDVFLQVWKKAASFDSTRGSFRTWVLQIAHHRTLNELRRRGRRPRLVSDPEGSVVDAAAHDPGPEEQVWGEYRRSVIQRALASLPPDQGRALRLAYFQDLTHAQIAEFLDVPLGTAKSRIRIALEKLNPRLAALVALLLAAVGVSAYQWNLGRLERGRDQRALDMLTGSRMETLRLVPAAPGEVEQGPHANYRAERGGTTAVFTLSHVPALPPGATYRLRGRSGGEWKVLGELTPGPDGRGRILIESKAMAWPEALRLDRELAAAPVTAAPAGTPFLAWSPAGKAP